jgi:hypothetical protein
VRSGPNWLEVSRGAWPLKAIDLDCNHIPDAAMTLAVMALYADGPSTLRNIASWRVKETDRIAAMATELRKLGAVVEEGADFIRVTHLPPGAVAGRVHPHLRRPPRRHVLVAGQPSTRLACPCASKTRSASPRPFRTTSSRCSAWRRRRQNTFR